MLRNKVKVVIDTNWWVSFLITKQKSQLTEVLYHSNIEIYSSEELKSEIFETIKDPSLSKYINPSTLKEFIECFPDAVLTIKIKSKVEICRDAKDNFLLALSKDAKADFLITGDKDLLILKKYGKTIILKLSDFIKLLT